MSQYFLTAECSSLERFNQIYCIPALLPQIIPGTDSFWIVLLFCSTLHCRDKERKGEREEAGFESLSMFEARDVHFRKLRHTFSLCVLFTSLPNNLGTKCLLLAQYLPVSTLSKVSPQSFWSGLGAQTLQS